MKIVSRSWRALVTVAMLALVVLPFPLAYLVKSYAPSTFDQLSGPALHGEVPTPRPRLRKLASVLEGTFQESVQSWVAMHLFLRNRVVRLTNAIYYSAFGRSYAGTTEIVVGRGGVLFEKQYIRAYCDVGPAAGLPAAMTEKLRRLQQLTAALHVPMLFVVSPSKATTMPEYLPANVCTPPANPLIGTARLVDQLSEAGVTVFNAGDAVRLMRAYDPLPPFPRGGIHWSNLASLRVSAKVVSTLSELGKWDIGNIELGKVDWDTSPIGTDADLAELLNLWQPPVDFPTGHANVGCRTTSEGQGIKLVAVGGSFSQGMLAPMIECKLFKRVDFYFYYKRLVSFSGTVPSDVVRDAVDWKQMLEGPSVLLVELNEAFLNGRFPFPWLDPFLDDILADLEATPPPG